MNLQNPFSVKTRMLWMDCWECQICRSNGTESGGLELHHIEGRGSDSALNSCLVCKGCHSSLGHSQDEEETLYEEALTFLYNCEYKLTKEDLEYVKTNKRLSNVISRHKIFTNWIKNNENNKEGAEAD
jgi:hypothetical protein